MKIYPESMVPNVILRFTEYCMFNFKIVKICGKISLHANPRSNSAISSSYFGRKIT
jgi:hypothetical protein